MTTRTVSAVAAWPTGCFYYVRKIRLVRDPTQ